ncbi:MAG: hypothetical protein MJY77_08200 [Bacteroidaceae bacterium]|nr:hypothetical protein [Bacteroidaceae bacterium]
MRKPTITYLVCAVTVMIALSSCSKGIKYDESDLYGTWSCSDGYTYEFDGNHTGKSFRNGFSPIGFEWSLDGDMLKMTHHGQDSGVFTETLIVTSLSINRMSCYNMIDPDEKRTFQRE